MKYNSLNRRLFKANDNEILNITGCLPKCDYYTYNSVPVGGMTNYKVDDTNAHLNNTVRIQLYFPTAAYQVMEEVKLE